MARTAWEIDEEELDVEQNNVRRLRVDRSFVCKRCRREWKNELGTLASKKDKRNRRNRKCKSFSLHKGFECFYFRRHQAIRNWKCKCHSLSQMDR